VSNQEKVARAAQRHPDCESEEGLNRWHCTGCGEVVATGSKHRARAAFHKHQAAAAIDALADVDGIAGVLLLHERIAYHSETNYEGQRVAWVSCGCGWVGEPRIADNIPLRHKEVADHQAAAVVAWMKDRA